MPFILRLIISSVAIMLGSYLLPGIHVNSFYTALLVALVLSLLNMFLKPLMILLTLPFTIFTFGLFLLVINAFIIMIAGAWVDGFKVDGFWWALIFSLILSVISSLLERLVKHDENTRNF